MQTRGNNWPEDNDKCGAAPILPAWRYALMFTTWCIIVCGVQVTTRSLALSGAPLAVFRCFACLIPLALYASYLWRGLDTPLRMAVSMHPPWLASIEAARKHPPAWYPWAVLVVLCLDALVHVGPVVLLHGPATQPWWAALAAAALFVVWFAVLDRTLGFVRLYSMHTWPDCHTAQRTARAVVYGLVPCVAVAWSALAAAA